jgi:putative spermidine/putrescine transport system permease protein
VDPLTAPAKGQPCRAGPAPLSLLLVAPALAMVLALFVYPLGYPLLSAFTTKDGQPSLDNFAKSFDFYGTDIVFTVVIIVVSTALTGVLAAAIGGYLVLGVHPAAVMVLKWLYRWPLFIPFIVAAQCMRTFLAKNGRQDTGSTAERGRHWRCRAPG